jgi:hypothetical protein
MNPVFQFLNEIHMGSLCFNTNPFAIRLLEQYPEKIVWEWLSENKNAIYLLEKTPDKIHWSALSGNENAIHLLEQHPEKIVWLWLSANLNAIHLLKQQPEKIDWGQLSSNPNAVHLMCSLDYQKTREANQWFRLELAERVLNPDRIFSQAKRLNLSFQECLAYYG